METMKRLTVLFFLLLLLAPGPCRAFQDPAPAFPGQELTWLPLEKGLDLTRISYSSRKSDLFIQTFTIRILRFDTTLFDFVLCSARWDGGQPYSIREWAELKRLSAGINASMYQTDGLTSTGYMRRGELTNNGRVVQRYGSFFVSGPRTGGLPRAAVLDREKDDWQALLPQYDTVIQNFRLMGPEGQQLWPKNGPRHAIAAIAEDLNGRILFLHCPQPVSVHDFVEALKAHSSLNLNSAMYVEGGSEATLMLNLPDGVYVWTGMSPANYMLSGLGNDYPLPSVLGVIPR